MTLQQIAADARLRTMRRSELLLSVGLGSLMVISSACSTLSPSFGGFSQRTRSSGPVSRLALEPSSQTGGLRGMDEAALTAELSRTVELGEGLKLVALPLTDTLVELREIKAAQRDRLPSNHLERRLRMKRRIYTSGKVCFQFDWVGAGNLSRTSLSEWSMEWQQDGAEKTVTPASEKLTMIDAPVGSRAIGCVIRSGQWQPDWSKAFRVIASHPSRAEAVRLEWIPVSTAH